MKKRGKLRELLTMTLDNEKEAWKKGREGRAGERRGSRIRSEHGMKTGNDDDDDDDDEENLRGNGKTKEEV